MDIVLGVIIGIVVLAILWNLRKGFFALTDGWKESIDIATSEDKVDRQEDYRALHTKVSEVRSRNGDKWFTLKDIEELMK